jgi:hypothetical protein
MERPGRKPAAVSPAGAFRRWGTIFTARGRKFRAEKARQLKKPAEMPDRFPWHAMCSKATADQVAAGSALLRIGDKKE